jgi:hypothetical protein
MHFLMKTHVAVFMNHLEQKRRMTAAPMSEPVMSEVVYISKSRIERKRGPLRIAHLPGEAQPVVYSVHGAIAEHYKVDPANLKESHASTIDYVISATAG